MNPSISFSGIFLFQGRSSLLGLLVVATILSACQREDPGPAYEVPAIVQPYVDAFIAEAQARGKDIQIDNLVVTFGTNLNGGTAAGLCTFAQSSNPPRIQLDSTSPNWQNPATRELLVFHELGHCILNRLHREDLLPNGNKVSLMRGDAEKVYGLGITEFKREYYLDELFDESVPVPIWAQNPPDYSSIPAANKQLVFEDEFDNNSNLWPIGGTSNFDRQVTGGQYVFSNFSSENSFFVEKGISGLNLNQDFEIEVEMQISSGQSLSTVLWGGNNTVVGQYYFGFSRDTVLIAGKTDVDLDILKTPPNLLIDGKNTLVIRRLGNNYHYYLNGEYADVARPLGLATNRIGFLVGPQTTLEVERVRLYALP